MPATSTPTASGPTDELPEELPPLDGEDDEEAGDSAGTADDLDDLPAGDHDPFDDSTGEADPVGAEWLDPLGGDGEEGDAEPDKDLEVGEEAVQLFASEEGWIEPGATDLPDTPDEDPDLVEAESMEGDAGEEGPLDADEAVREEDLPALDADDGGEGEDAHFFDSLAAEDTLFPWAADRWEPTPVVTHTHLGHVHSVVPAPRGAVALTTRLVRIEVDGAVAPLSASGLPSFGPPEGCALASHAGALFFLTEAGVYRSDDGGETFAITDEAPGDEAALSMAAVRGALTLPRGFELAAATHDGADLLAVVRALAFGRLYVIRVAEPAKRASPRPAPAAEIVAEMAEPEFEGDGEGDLTAAWDRERGLLWLGGPFGLLAFQPRRQAT